MCRNQLTLAIAASLLLPIAALRAQTAGGSSYSVFNLGDIQPVTTAAGVSRGHVEVATFSPRSVNSTNPAMWGDLENVTIQAGLLFSQSKLSDAGGSIAQNRTALQNFSAGFPISSLFHATLAAGLKPFSTVSYRTLISAKAPTVTGDSVTSSSTYFGEGGVSEAFFGTSFAPIPEVTVGLSGARYFGTVNNTTKVAFPGNELNPATYARNEHFGGWGLHAGLLVRPIPAVGIGLAFETPVDLTRDREDITSFTEQSENVVDTSARTSSSVTIPSRITAGASWSTGRFLLSAEGSLQTWEGGSFSSARNSMRVGAGMDRLGAAGAGSRGFDRWTLRLGGYYDQTYYNVGGKGIDDYGFTLGAGIPLTTTTNLTVGTLLEVALDLGRRGVTDSGLTQELYARLNIELAVSELWFVRSRR